MRNDVAKGGWHSGHWVWGFGWWSSEAVIMWMQWCSGCLSCCSHLRRHLLLLGSVMWSHQQLLLWAMLRQRQLVPPERWYWRPFSAWSESFGVFRRPCHASHRATWRRSRKPARWSDRPWCADCAPDCYFVSGSCAWTPPSRRRSRHRTAASACAA